MNPFYPLFGVTLRGLVFELALQILKTACDAPGRLYRRVFETPEDDARAELMAALRGAGFSTISSGPVMDSNSEMRLPPGFALYRMQSQRPA